MANLAQNAAPMRRKRLLAKMGQQPLIVGGQATISPANPNTGQPAHVSRQKSDTRFRSFAERWMVARAHLMTPEPERLAEETWQAIMDAKRAYNMIRSAGENIDPEDGVF